MTAISFVIPTHDRADDVRLTLNMLGKYPLELLGDLNNCEVIVVENASAKSERCELPMSLANGIKVQSIRLDTNIATKARNVGVKMASGDWIVMLDDDSAPIEGDFGNVLARQHNEMAAIGGEIKLSSGGYEAGGLPEVIIGCGCAIRRDAYLEVGGYDDTFGYYAEEYDLCAKLIIAGYHIAHTRALKFEHRKVLKGRNFAEILYRLVRNNAWVLTRYAPLAIKDEVLNAMYERYQQIAVKEGVEPAFDRAMADVQGTLASQPIHTMTEEQWDRFSGASAVRQGLITNLRKNGIQSVRLVARSKGVEILEQELSAAGIRISDSSIYQVLATLSPGSMLSQYDDSRTQLVPWSFE